MASLLVSGSASLADSLTSTSTTASFKPPRVSTLPAIRFPSDPTRRSIRGLPAVTRAGPNTSSYVFAFALPFSLLAITIFASIRVADKLDRDFLQELAINQAIREANEEEAIKISLKKEPALQRTRNRPKRGA